VPRSSFPVSLKKGDSHGTPVTFSIPFSSPYLHPFNRRSVHSNLRDFLVAASMTPQFSEPPSSPPLWCGPLIYDPFPARCYFPLDSLFVSPPRSPLPNVRLCRSFSSAQPRRFPFACVPFPPLLPSLSSRCRPQTDSPR